MDNKQSSASSATAPALGTAPQPVHGAAHPHDRDDRATHDVVDRDPWLRALLAQPADGAVARARRVKLGYNPNSSSVGSVLTTLVWGTTLSAVALNIAAALVRKHSGSIALVGFGARPPDAPAPVPPRAAVPSPSAVPSDLDIVSPQLPSPGVSLPGDATKPTGDP